MKIRSILSGTITISLLLPLTFNPSFSQNKLTIEDIWGKYVFATASVDEFNSMKDGEHYTAIQDDPLGGQILLVYSYLRGKVTDTIVLEKNLIPQDSTKPIHPDDYVLSEDESKVLLRTANEKVYRRSSKANYFIYDRKSGKTTPLSAGGKQQSPAFSPDGNKVAFVRDNNLFSKDLLTGKESRLTDDGKKNSIINGIADWVYEEEFEFVQAHQWSPDSKYLAYYQFDETEVPQYTVQFFKGLYPENYTYKYPKVGEKNSVISMYILDISSNKRIKIDLGATPDQYIPRIKWTDDPKLLCILRMNRWQNKLELILADAVTGQTRVMFTEENKRYIEIHDHLDFFNDNKNFVWTSEMNGYNHIYTGNVADGKLTQITNGNWDVTDFYGIDEKGKKMYYQSAEESPLKRNVYEISLDGKKKKMITPESGWNDAEFNSSFTYMMVTHSDANAPNDYKLYNMKGDVIRVLEDNKALKEKLKTYSLSRQEFFTFTTTDGTQLNGWMIKPWNFDASKKYPVLMTEYGGPGSQEVTDQWGSTDHMYHEYLAQEGYLIACIDNRGTGARGEEFKKMTYMKLGQYEPVDQIEAAKYLGTLAYVDKARIGIFGWSYGGYLSSLCIAIGNDVFKSAIAVAPVSDLRFYDTIYTERYMRDNNENKDGYDKGAPVNYAGQIKGNFLLVHGLADDNVHYQNTAEFLKALYKNNVVFDQMTFPDKNHSITGGNTRYYLFSRIAEWTKENL